LGGAFEGTRDSVSAVSARPIPGEITRAPLRFPSRRASLSDRRRYGRPLRSPAESSLCNEIDRFSLAIDVIDRTAKLQKIGGHAKERFRDMQTECRNYAYERGMDKLDVAAWRWPY